MDFEALPACGQSSLCILTSLQVATITGVNACAASGSPIVGGVSNTCALTDTGAIALTGTQTNGADRINHVNVNGTINPLTYSGADIGTQVNAAIAANSQGATILIPPGVYSDATTIQCPVAASNPAQPFYIIEGAGADQAEGNTNGTKGTIIQYTGSGDLFNQFVSSTSSQNTTGCQLRDLKLDGSSATGTANGVHFGGVVNTTLHNMSIRNFPGSGVEIENASGMWTERYKLDPTDTFYRNATGIYIHCDAGCNPSVSHSDINVFMNVNVGQVAFKMDGGADNYSSDVTINGNIEGSGSGGTLVKLNTGAFFAATLTDKTECQETTCTRFNIDSTSVFAGRLNISGGGGTYTNTIAVGGNLEPEYQVAASQGIFIRNHIVSGGAAPMPTISSCGTGSSMSSGSTDMDGEIVVGSGTGVCTLTYAQPWTTANESCVLTDDGHDDVWFTTNKTNTSVTFNCELISGTPCTAVQAVQYHCMGFGGW
jgi:hypothetical protein